VQQHTQLTEFTDAQRAEALRQFQVIRPFLEDGVPLTRLATEHKLQLRTLRRWVQRYRADGLEVPPLLWNGESLGYTIPEGEPGSCKKCRRETIPVRGLVGVRPTFRSLGRHFYE